ncbi:hypothetical protein M9H77_02186 [Catharanthus roseus]|uniref:Uncharacterized protein n=1 Tax=Catharanthus roseus TaxID=4058 RepID=A0ACC0C7P0_CATRO|nr:hypothetical protein M9H77_02186 [Catharanthus roseus]
MRTKPVVDDEEEEVQVKRRGPYGTKKYDCPFKLKGELMAMCENWQVFVHDGRYNHAIGVYIHGHAQVAKLTEEQLIQTEQFRKRTKRELCCQKRYNMPLLEVVGMTPTERLAKLTELAKDEEVASRVMEEIVGRNRCAGILKEIGCSEDEVEEQTGLPTLFVQ